MNQHIVTANDLTTGEVLFYTAAHTWTNRFHGALIMDTVVAETLMREAQNDELGNLVVGVYLIDVTVEAGKPVPVRFREKLRIYGPSIHQQFQKPLSAGVKAA